MSLFNPWVILGIISMVLTSFGGGYWKGTDAERQRQQIEIARLNQEARETEQRMAAIANTYAQTLRKANNAARVKENKLRSDIADGAIRLRVPVKTVCPIRPIRPRLRVVDCTVVALPRLGVRFTVCIPPPVQCFTGATVSASCDIQSMETTIKNKSKIKL